MSGASRIPAGRRAAASGRRLTSDGGGGVGGGEADHRPRPASHRAVPAAEGGSGGDDVVHQEHRPRPHAAQRPSRRTWNRGPIRRSRMRAAGLWRTGLPDQQRPARKAEPAPRARRASSSAWSKPRLAPPQPGGRRPGDRGRHRHPAGPGPPCRRPATPSALRALRYLSRTTSSRAAPRRRAVHDRCEAGRDGHRGRAAHGGHARARTARGPVAHTRDRSVGRSMPSTLRRGCDTNPGPGRPTRSVLARAPAAPARSRSSC